MSSPFAALEGMLNQSVMQSLANATAVLEGALVSGVYDSAYTVADAIGQGVGMSAAQPQFMLLTSQVPPCPVGKALVFTDRPDLPNYRVAEHRPDGTGMSTLILEEDTL